MFPFYYSSLQKLCSCSHCIASANFGFTYKTVAFLTLKKRVFSHQRITVSQEIVFTQWKTLHSLKNYLPLFHSKSLHLLTKWLYWTDKFIYKIITFHRESLHSPTELLHNTATVHSLIHCIPETSTAFICKTIALHSEALRSTIAFKKYNHHPISPIITKMSSSQTLLNWFRYHYCF